MPTSKEQARRTREENVCRKGRSVAFADDYARAHSLWMAKHLKIINKASKMVPLHPNGEQMRLLWSFGAQRGTNLPIRAYVLKSRRIGISTLVEGLYFEDVYMRPYRKALVCAHSADSSQTIFDMTRIMDTELPVKMVRPKDASSRKELKYSSPHYSHFQVLTAGAREIGRSKEVHDLHCSEVAFWPTPRETLGALMQGVAEEVDSKVVLETTANGVGGEFYDRWVSRMERLSAHPEDLTGFMPLFFSWLDFPEYRREVPTRHTLNPYTEDEQYLQSLGAEDEQLWWRRRVLEDKCGGDVAMFRQEYPATWREAFQYSGRQAIHRNILTRHQETVCAPRRKVRLVRDGDKVHAENYEGNEFCWYVWHEPEEGSDYCVAGDVAENRLSNPLDETSDLDYSAASVLNRRQMRFDATFRGRIDPDLFGYELVKAALWYNKAWTTPEVNSPGWSTLTVMKDYPKIYVREGSEDLVDESARRLSHLGWMTTNSNRDNLVDDYIALCRPSPMTGWDGRLTVLDDRMLSEEMTFVIDRNGKRQHRPGCHDDLLFSAFICVQLHHRCPREASGPYKEAKRRGGKILVPSWRYAGGRDPGVKAMPVLK